ncbi:unnamed protein product [Phytophthora lilii]|uniref:Unnamed protein product n=1 Tax=Phytophthora lilii TaxID=2077276 RepID=A0A9W6TSZ2_9STRA|nr:unnamed protein product [Phytophthora lilii]
MGKRLTPQEIAERRAKRADRRAATDKEEEKGDAMFIEGSVRPYQRHYVIVEPQNTDPTAWPPKLERSPEHILSSYMGALVKLYGGDIIKVKKSPLLVTAAIPYTGMCSGGLREETETSDSVEEGAHDILVFPDAVRVHNVMPSQSTCVERDVDERDVADCVCWYAVQFRHW